MKQVQGVVVSAKMQKTVVVRTERLVQHARYKKYVIQRTQVKARSEQGLQVGDVVVITPSRPFSRHVCWRVVNVVGRKALADAQTGPESSS